jgi:hypothetical protein
MLILKLRDYFSLPSRMFPARSATAKTIRSRAPAKPTAPISRQAEASIHPPLPFLYEASREAQVKHASKTVATDLELALSRLTD